MQLGWVGFRVTVARMTSDNLGMNGDCLGGGIYTCPHHAGPIARIVAHPLTLVPCFGLFSFYFPFFLLFSACFTLSPPFIHLIDLASVFFFLSHYPLHFLYTIAFSTSRLTRKNFRFSFSLSLPRFPPFFPLLFFFFLLRSF